MTKRQLENQVRRFSTEIKNAVDDVLAERIDRENYGMLSNYRSKMVSHKILSDNGIKITSRLSTTDEVTQNGRIIAKIIYRYAAHKRNGMYKMLKPKVEYL